MAAALQCGMCHMSAPGGLQNTWAQLVLGCTVRLVSLFAVNQQTSASSGSRLFPASLLCCMCFLYAAKTSRCRNPFRAQANDPAGLRPTKVKMRPKTPLAPAITSQRRLHGLPLLHMRLRLNQVLEAQDASSEPLASCPAGFMSNRGRQNVASYLVLDLGIDWRHGADWFESVLVDYDVCSNWGNWVAAAGMTGGRINHFNIIKQSRVGLVLMT